MQERTNRTVVVVISSPFANTRKSVSAKSPIKTSNAGIGGDAKDDVRRGWESGPAIEGVKR